MSTGSNISIRSQPGDLSGSADDLTETHPNSSSSKQLSVGMVEAKLKELTKMYNAEKE